MTTLRAEVARLAKLVESRLRHRPAVSLNELRADPSLILSRAGLTPDPWQRDLLRSGHRRTIVLATRQGGKSQTSAALALREALLNPGSLTLLVSPSLRQSGELFRDKVLPVYNRLGRPVRAVRETMTELCLANGSRVVSLPASVATILGYSRVALLILDEAARVPDELYVNVRPMLAVSGGALVAVSTAYVKAGWFYSTWSGDEPWQRVKVTADQCPRISPEFLAEESRALGDRWFNMQYRCEFADAVDAVFRGEDIAAALAGAAEPLWGAAA